MKTFEKKRDPKETERFGAHVEAILFGLRAGPLTREKLVAAVDKRLGENTVQSGARIVSFQAPRMIEKGLIKVTVTKDEKSASAAKKAVPAKKKAVAKKTVVKAKPVKRVSKKKTKPVEEIVETIENDIEDFEPATT